MNRVQKRRNRIYRFIKRYHDEHGIAPSNREICAGVGLSAGAVVNHLKRLEEQGYIKRIPLTARGIVVIQR